MTDQTPGQSPQVITPFFAMYVGRLRSGPRLVGRIWLAVPVSTSFPVYKKFPASVLYGSKKDGGLRPRGFVTRGYDLGGLSGGGYDLRGLSRGGYDLCGFVRRGYDLGSFVRRGLRPMRFVRRGYDLGDLSEWVTT